MTGLFLSNLCENIVKKSIRKFTDIFLNFLNIFTEHGKIIADYTKRIDRISQLLCRTVIVERLYKGRTCAMYQGNSRKMKFLNVREF